MSPRLVMRRDAADRIASLPGVAGHLEAVAAAVAPAIVAGVPRRRGMVVRTFRPQVVRDGDAVRLVGFGPFWHLIEFGTYRSPAHRPITNALSAVAGVRWAAR